MSTRRRIYGKNALQL